MMTMSGVLQIGAIIKEDVTKNGDKMVYFVGYSRRGEEYDKIFCKVFGKQAEYLIRNLPKKEDGTYASRKIEVSGFLETYTQRRAEKCDPYILQPSELDVRFGTLNQAIQIIFTKEMEEDKFLLRVNHLEFVDKKKEVEFVEIFAGNAVALDVPENNEVHNNIVKEPTNHQPQIINQTKQEIIIPDNI